MNKPTIPTIFDKPAWVDDLGAPITDKNFTKWTMLIQGNETSKTDWAHYGEGIAYTKDCHCSACEKLRSLFHPAPYSTVVWGSGGWCDPRRGYHESEEDFIKRVPDGILRWPADHIPPKNVL